MSVYVDDVRHKFRRMIMCHLWADTEEELHTFAGDVLGIQRKWFQEPPKASWKHYDISAGKKAIALLNGAVLTDIYGPVEHLARLRGDQAKLDQIARIRAKPTAEDGPPMADLLDTPKPATDTAYGGLSSGYLVRATMFAGVWFYGADNMQAAEPIALQTWMFRTQEAAQELVDRLKLHAVTDRKLEVLDMHMGTTVQYSVVGAVQAKGKPEPRRGPAGSRPGRT